MSIEGTTLYCGDNCNHTGPCNPRPTAYVSAPHIESRPCFCVGGPNCCIVRAQREREEALREEGRQEERRKRIEPRRRNPTVRSL